MSWLPRKTIVVPIDFSDDSFAALDTAQELVDNPGHLHLIHVLPIITPNDPGVIWEMIDDQSRAVHAEGALRKKLARQTADGAQVAIRFGDPGHQIVDYAQEVRADLIALSSHGQTGLTRLLLGSVAEKVVRLARCPVLVLKKAAKR
ncbi:MAG: universal stress protein [Thermoguttaceae bacterium]|jgi:nucleotide-binding universal stress UspA family protein